MASAQSWPWREGVTFTPHGFASHPAAYGTSRSPVLVATARGKNRVHELAAEAASCRAAELERELEIHRQQLAHEFDLSPYQMPNATCLRAGLLVKEHELKQDLVAMAHDLQAVQDDAGFKRWLKLQKQLSRESDFPDVNDFRL